MLTKLDMYLIISGPVLLLLVGSLVSPFSFIQLLIIGAVYLLIWRVFGKDRAYVSVWLGTIFTWASVFLTYYLSVWSYDFLAQNVHAISGAPITVFKYPFQPLSSAGPIINQWPSFFFNYIFWIAISVLMSKWFATLVFKKTKYGRPLLYALPLTGFGFMVAGLIHVILKFD